MASKYECPRCGCGIKPSDVQCDRCGEVLRQVAPKVPTEKVKPIPVPVPPSDSMRGSGFSESQEKMRITLEQKDRDLSKREMFITEREKEIAEITDSVEKGSSDLEEAISKFEHEKEVLQDKERGLLEREQHILELMERMESGMNELAGYVEKGKAGQLGPDELKAAVKLKEKESVSFDAERRRLRREVQEVGIDNLGKVIELEARLRSAEQQLNKCRDEAARREELSVAPIKFAPDPKIVREIERAIDDQIGIGYVESEKGTPIPTYIEKLDTILGGGIPAGHLVLVTGGPGCMKSTLTFNILYNISKNNHMSCMYFSLEQTRESIIRQMSRLGMKIDDTGNRMMVVDMVGLRTSMENEPGDWRSILLRYVKNVHEQMPFSMFVLDSLESFKSVSSYDFSRQDLKDLFDWFKTLNITVLLIAEGASMSEEDVSQEAYLADGVIEMMLKELDDSKVQRWLRVPKMRGMNIDTRYYALFHNNESFVLTMPIVEMAHHHSGK